MLPRGIRNNNPLNIRRGKDQWQGLRAQQTDANLTSDRLSSRSADSKQASVCSHYDAEFCQFESLEYGWRAAFYLLTRTYYHKYRLYTIRMIVNKWAPPRIAMAIQENGIESLDYFAMLRGWGLARPSAGSGIV